MRVPSFQILPPDEDEQERDEQFWRDVETSTRIHNSALVENLIAALCLSRALVESASADDVQRDVAARRRERELRDLVARRGYGGAVINTAAA